jgi:murein DD-endopeptidase MepM/ murein hydrolase activator NlpD
MGPALQRVAVSRHAPTKDRCMDPQRLARLLDGRTVLRAGTGTAGVLTAVRSTSESAQTVEERGVLVTRSSAHGVCLTALVPLAEDAPATAGPLAGLDVPAVALPAEDGDDAPAEALDAPALVTEVAAGRSRGGRRPLAVLRRKPALYLAAALLGVTGLGLVATGPLTAEAAPAEVTSVAEELALHRAADSALTGDEAAARLQEMVASRAEREDAQAAAAQVQAAADQAATDAAAAAAAEAAEAARPKVVLPIDGARISSGFGSRWGTLHAGVDFAAPMGTPEYAAMDGVVVKAGAASGFGLAVYVQHADGDVTVYGHMEKILVQEGQTVRAGETIALLGNRGQSTGPHLHFEVHLGGMGGQKVDPLPWLRERGAAV